MKGLMQDRALLVSGIVEHAARFHGDAEIVTHTPEGGPARSNWREVRRRAQKVAEALARLGVRFGDRVGTLSWNTFRHVELWYGISGMGAICHTINPRLFPEQIAYIVNHAGDEVLFFDLDFLPLVESLKDRIPGVKHFVVLTDARHMPETASFDLLCHEELLDAEEGVFSWPQFDERTASSLCYTSGTTGNPKGVLYSHRSNVLHTLGANSTDYIGLGAGDTIMPVVPMFHANAWGIPFCAAAAGSKMVLNGPAHDAPTLRRLIVEEGVTCTAAVPTVWLAMLDYLDRSGLDLGPLKRVVIGGSAVPQAMIERFMNGYGIEVRHAWGMTEMSPLGSMSVMNQASEKLDAPARMAMRGKQGRPVYGVEMRIADEDGQNIPHDGKTAGHLMVRGFWVAESYFKGEGGGILDKDGWFDTGDVALIDEYGFMKITDRSKDVIKSGGEWISSIDVENAALGHPDVAEAAVIGIPHPKWAERPLLILVAKGEKRPDKAGINAYLSGRIAKWWLPDDVVYVKELPHTATGKIQKTALRHQFRDYKFPDC